MAVSLPILHHTSVADVSDIVDRLRKTFHKQKTKPLSYRLVQLRKLYWGYVCVLCHGVACATLPTATAC